MAVMHFLFNYLLQFSGSAQPRLLNSMEISKSNRREITDRLEKKKKKKKEFMQKKKKKKFGFE